MPLWQRLDVDVFSYASLGMQPQDRRVVHCRSDRRRKELPGRTWVISL